MATAPDASTPSEREGTGHEPAPDDRSGPSRESELATSAVAYLLAGPLAFGGIGFGLDRLLDTWFFLALGVLVGMALSIYVIWLRYGTP